MDGAAKSDEVASRLNIDISKPLKADEVLPSIKQYERKSRYEVEEVCCPVQQAVYERLSGSEVEEVYEGLSGSEVEEVCLPVAQAVLDHSCVWRITESGAGCNELWTDTAPRSCESTCGNKDFRQEY